MRYAGAWAPAFFRLWGELMNIKRAKEEIKNSVKAYLTKDELGDYVMPAVRQRPILLIGPSGIGKTAIMEQIASECGIALVSYTITHHTLQSALGLPYVDKIYHEKEAHSVTEYTLSEIIAAIYNRMNATGLSEGILFVDEINCVSDSLAPTMLQFLQSKCFGNHKVPEGWVIVAAGNPPEYNNSVREFDVVTLDRVKRIDVEPDHDVWSIYAYKSKIHGAVMAYLGYNPDKFYAVKITSEGKNFVTARGWEDLSAMLQMYEQLGLSADAHFVSEYLQHPEIAADFAEYYSRYNAYKARHQIERVLAGESVLGDALFSASEEERFSVTSIILDELNRRMAQVEYDEIFLNKVSEIIEKAHEIYLRSGASLREDVTKFTEDETLKIQQRVAANTITGNELKARKSAVLFCDELAKKYSAATEEYPVSEAAFAPIVEKVVELKAECALRAAECEKALSRSFDYVIRYLGEGKELEHMVRELGIGYYANHFVSAHPSDVLLYYFKKLCVETPEEL